jgi:hypothetical protein
MLHALGKNMSFLATQSEAPAALAGTPHGVGSAVNAGETAAPTFTARTVQTPANEVPAHVAKQLAVQAEKLQAISAQFPAILRRLVDVLTVGNGSIAATDAANAAAAADEREFEAMDFDPSPPEVNAATPDTGLRPSMVWEQHRLARRSA